MALRSNRGRRARHRGRRIGGCGGVTGDTVIHGNSNAFVLCGGKRGRRSCKCGMVLAEMHQIRQCSSLICTNENMASRQRLGGAYRAHCTCSGEPAHPCQYMGPGRRIASTCLVGARMCRLHIGGDINLEWTHRKLVIEGGRQTTRTAMSSQQDFAEISITNVGPSGPVSRDININTANVGQ